MVMCLVGDEGNVKERSQRWGIYHFFIDSRRKLSRHRMLSLSTLRDQNVGRFSRRVAHDWRVSSTV